MGDTVALVLLFSAITLSPVPIQITKQSLRAGQDSRRPPPILHQRGIQCHPFAQKLSVDSHYHSSLSTPTHSYLSLQLPLSTFLAKSLALAKLVYSFPPNI